MAIKPFKCPKCDDPSEQFKDCAFFKDGTFDTDNWNCGTMQALFAVGDTVYGNDQSITLISHPVEVGMIALSTYKAKGNVAKALFINADKGPTPELTLALAEKFLKP